MMRVQNRRTANGACKRKRRMRDHAEAVRVLQRLQSRSTRAVVPHRAYHCDQCNGFHLTSKPKRSDVDASESNVNGREL